MISEVDVMHCSLNLCYAVRWYIQYYAVGVSFLAIPPFKVLVLDNNHSLPSFQSMVSIPHKKHENIHMLQIRVLIEYFLLLLVLGLPFPVSGFLDLRNYSHLAPITAPNCYVEACGFGGITIWRLRHQSLHLPL